MHSITWMIRTFTCIFSCGFGNWDWELKITDRALFWQHIKRRGNKKGFEFLVSKKFYSMVKSPFTRWLWQVNGMTTTVLKVKMLKLLQTKLTQVHAFLKSNTFISNTSCWNWQKIKQKLSNTLRLNFCYLKIMHFVHPRYHSKIIGDIIKNVQKQVPLFKCGYMINDIENEAENEK